MNKPIAFFKKISFAALIILNSPVSVRAETDWYDLWRAPPKCYKIEESVRAVNLRTDPWKLSKVEKKRVGLYMTSLPISTDQFPEELYLLDLGKANSVITVIFPRLNCETYCKGAAVIGDGSAMKQYDFLYKKSFTLFKFGNTTLDTKALHLPPNRVGTVFPRKDGFGVMVLYFLNKDYFKNDYFPSLRTRNSEGTYFGIIQSGMLAQEDGEAYIQDNRNLKLLNDTGKLVKLQEKIRIRADSGMGCPNFNY